MTKTNNLQIDPILQYLIHLAPTLKKLFPSDVIINISDLERLIFEIQSKEVVTEPYDPNRLLTDQDLLYHVMRNNRPQSMEVDKQYYGAEVFVTMVPITNLVGKVIGSLSISSSIENRAELIRISDIFASSTEKISSSTIGLSANADHLTQFMGTITIAQENLSRQVNDSSVILDMINSVAKSTRILGLNAGIEAARSGDHGKGFAVVAKEITKLADQSSNAVDEIRQLLNSMHEKVAEVSNSVNDTMEITETQSTSIHEIANSIKQIAKVAEKIDELAQKI